MIKLKPANWKTSEFIGYLIVVLFVIINAFVTKDYYVAAISAVCGISYTFMAGKGMPICYVYGVIGSGFYSFLSFKNALWGNLFLYSCYYVPMQVLGFVHWNKHLKEDANEIVKIRTPLKQVILITLLNIIGIIGFTFVLKYFNDIHPILDSITTILSVTGMYFTVRRAIEQWVAWAIVNLLSFIMWFYVALSGAKVLSTLIMWGVYVFLSFYFYFIWRKEIKLSKQN